MARCHSTVVLELMTIISGACSVSKLTRFAITGKALRVLLCPSKQGIYMNYIFVIIAGFDKMDTQFCVYG